ncbi:unnamed protein product [Protopolystoma xenopodis]|uniref:RRM domain-containing protein n=1 Tax=Protopolystoma xenopodis TaxID=117903 RepID=A0A3S5BNS8_9PLAT|nr:unnamed protein product [Protopolystoma xenopodis]
MCIQVARSASQPASRSASQPASRSASQPVNQSSGPNRQAAHSPTVTMPCCDVNQLSGEVKSLKISAPGMNMSLSMPSASTSAVTTVTTACGLPKAHSSSSSNSGSSQPLEVDGDCCLPTGSSSITGAGDSTGTIYLAASGAGFVGKQDNQNAAALPPVEAIHKLVERTNYQIVQQNGQRCYGPPPGWTLAAPQRGCEVFVGKIPRDCYEDELIPVFERIGPIYMFRLMMDFNGANRGFGFCVYTSREDTKRAVSELNNYEIRKGKTIGVCLSVDNCRLFVGGIPKNKTRDEILSEMRRVTDGVRDVISYPSVNDKTKNRGFAFVEYDSHRAAAMARRKLLPGHIQLWGQQIAVDWAEPEREVNEDIMSKVISYVLSRH